jgi:tRNA(fMet)-specific endonuclease VapC
MMRGDIPVLERLRAVEKPDVGLPQPVIAEIEYGLARLPRSRRRDALRARFDLICSELPHAAWTDAVSARFGTIKAELERRGRPIEDFDLAIAAHALAHEAVLVTSDASHMPRVRGLVIEDWARSSA